MRICTTIRQKDGTDKRYSEAAFGLLEDQLHNFPVMHDGKVVGKVDKVTRVGDTLIAEATIDCTVENDLISFSTKYKGDT